MADSWYEYVYGTPEQDAQEWHRNVQQYAKLKASPEYQELRHWKPFEHNGRTVDPRELRMAFALDSLVPGNTSDATEDMAYAANYAIDFGSRPRDTAFRAAQELANGNYADAAGKIAASPLTPFVPSLASGTPGSADDWRQHAGPVQGMILDQLTDPMNYASLGLKPAVRALPRLLGRARGARVADEAGDIIRQLRNSARAQPMRIEYAPR